MLHLLSYLTTFDFFQTACLSQYEHKDLAEFLEGLWASLRREVCLRRIHMATEALLVTLMCACVV